MISLPLLKQTIKSNLKLLLIFTGVLCLLFFVVIFAFNPDNFKVPFIEFVGGHYLGLLAPIFLTIYLIIVGNRLISGKVDKGDMAYSLSAPVTRLEIAITSAVFLIGSLALMLAIVGGAGVLATAIKQPEELNMTAYWQLILGEFVLQFAIGGIVFGASCIFNRTSRSLIIGAGLPVLFLAANILTGVSQDLEIFKYMSIFTLFDMNSIFVGKGLSSGLIFLAAIGVILLAAGMKVFKEKDLPL